MVVGLLCTRPQEGVSIAGRGYPVAMCGPATGEGRLCGARVPSAASSTACSHAAGPDWRLWSATGSSHHGDSLPCIWGRTGEGGSRSVCSS